MVETDDVIVLTPAIQWSGELENLNIHAFHPPLLRCSLQRGSPFEILLDLRRVLAKRTLEFLVERAIAVVDVIHRLHLLCVAPPGRVSFLLLVLDHLRQPISPRLPQSMEHNHEYITIYTT